MIRGIITRFMEADDLRYIIESAIPSGRLVRLELWVHIIDDLNAYYAGGRSASDTARILQSRVQLYLDEQR